MKASELRVSDAPAWVRVTETRTVRSTLPPGAERTQPFWVAVQPEITGYFDGLDQLQVDGAVSFCTTKLTAQLVAGQREIYQRCLDSDGWFDTGDLARPDGRGGIRITGRRDDLIIRRWGTKVPTLEVEAVLLRHPRVRELVLIGYPDPELPTADGLCAVLVPDGPAPSLDDLTGYLDGVGMTWQHWPDRVELRAELPRNELGKVQRSVLRRELEQATTGE